MKLFGSFCVIFIVIFSVVLVVTGEWHNRVQPALRRAIVSRVLGDDAVRELEASADSSSVAAGRETAAGATSPDHGGSGAAREVQPGSPTKMPPAASSIEAAIAGYARTVESWQGAHRDSLAAMQEEIGTMRSRISGLEAQLRILHAARDQGELDAWKALARVFASMRAEEAAAIVQHLPDSQAVQLLSSMKPASSAELMAKIEPGRAARLSGRLTAYLRDLQTEAHLQ